MPHVAVTINGRTYRMACDAGQEGHLQALASRFDGYVGQLRGSFGEIGDQRLTVMAGIMVTDELQEMERRIGNMESELASLRAAQHQTEARIVQIESDTAHGVQSAAERIETLARKLAFDRPAK